MPNPSGLRGGTALEGVQTTWRPEFCQQANPLSATARAPAQMVALGDSAAFIRPPSTSSNSVSPGDPLYVSFPYIFPAWGYAGVGDWHDGKANMVFCDAHIETARQSLWMSADEERRRLWNNDHLPHPECF